MAKQNAGSNSRHPAVLSEMQIRAAIPKLHKRLDELEALNVNLLSNDDEPKLEGFSHKIASTLRDVYGADSIEYYEYSPGKLAPQFSIFWDGMDTSLRGNLNEVREKVDQAKSRLTTAIELLEEKLPQTGQTGESTTSAIQAYRGLDLHKEVARVASSRYLSGHYADAVEASVKALNALVRLRSGLEQDGSFLMERAFNPSNPALKFNDLADQSDKDEQKGFMMLFSGAVAGLRNPRAHGFINDDPERALEFIAFISLLAKLLDETSQKPK
ncbi:TIGR02391 family protein [Acidisoma silvae]|uniref:TIGR02391 family protein n=1 Tax=Acidisoma silvae TaxID=2802396 RepID=A0A963YWF8_9PROT|nr:TIGR02391 family protein [Acidisoma silvae]MCB8877617.1 TIGR02391 family protein [Acidisoma silvae]